MIARVKFTTLLECFMRRVDIIPGGCWEWRGYRNPVTGYGQLSYRPKGEKTITRSAHRLSHELNIGPIPVMLTVDHKCRNRGCVNPRHFEIVTLEVNQERGNWGRKKSLRV